MWFEGFNLMIAGPGSTAAALAALVFQLGSEEGQLWQENLRSLIVDDGDGSEDPGIMCSELNALIKETLRLHSPFPTAYPRVITPGAEEGIIPHTTTALPVGTMVSANTYVLDRSEEIWGSDAGWGVRHGEGRWRISLLRLVRGRGVVLGGIWRCLLLRGLLWVLLGRGRLGVLGG